MNCPSCKSEKIKKNGSIHNGKQKYACKDCNRQFVQEPRNRLALEKQKLLERLLLERLPLAGIAMVL
jgi:transposase-like protein